MKYSISKEYLEEILNFLGSLPYAQVKPIFDKLAKNVEVAKNEAEPLPEVASDK
jgi:hypothetical protein